MDKDTRILFGATEGLGSFRRFPELTPLYGNNFDRHEISVGREWNTYFGFIPWVPAYVARATPLVDFVYDYAGTGAAGLGSQRYALTVRGGLSFRFGSMDDAEAIIRLRLGVGAAYNILNFGKGIVPSGDFDVNVAAQASASFVYCLNQYLCVGPKMAVGGDASAGYSTFYGTLGFEINGKVGPQGRLDVNPPVEPKPVPTPVVKPATAPVTKPVVTPVAPPPMPHVCPPTVCPPVAVCPPVTPPVSPPVTPHVCPPVTVCPPPPPPVDCEKVRKPLIDIIDRCKEDVENEKKICKEKIKNCEPNVKCTDKIKWIGGVRYLTVVKPQWMVLFQNDRIELELLEQKFPLKPAKAWGKGHPTLDAVVRKMHDWVNAIQQKGAAQPYTIDITVRGFANETGGTARNVELANGRAEVVLKYLTSAKNTRNYKGEIVKPLEANGILKSITAVKYSADIDPRDKIREVLLAGKDISSLDEKQKLALEQDVQNPIWRMALIEFKITGPDGKEISVDDFSKKIGIEGGLY